MNPCKTLMIQGTTSDAGESTLVAGLCRVLALRNVKVAPCKPQKVDVFARTALATQELPVGIITAAIGSVFFLAILARKR